MITRRNFLKLSAAAAASAFVSGKWFTGRVLKRDLIPAGGLALFDALVPLFRLERLLPWRVGQSLIAIGEKAA